jgi:hypothetical protein
LQLKVAGWALVRADALAAAEPELPERLSDRGQDS